MPKPNAARNAVPPSPGDYGSADRRTVLRAGAAVATGTGLTVNGWRFVTAQESGTPSVSDDGTPVACVLTPELTEGPFFLDGDLVRKDITEGRPGVPLTLKIGVINPSTCSPVENVAVDIWHCDALGYYSGVAASPPGNGDPLPDDLEQIAEDNFLRGIQITDEAGQVEFETIYPGWYPGRAIHIHLKVHVGGSVDDVSDTYQSGHAVHTGQLFFDEETNERVFAEEPYASRVTPRLPNDQDRILGNFADEPGFILDLEPVSDNAIAEGLIGRITIGVDPDRAP